MSTKKNLQIELLKLQEEIELLTLENEKQLEKIKEDIKNKKAQIKQMNFVENKHKPELLTLDKTRKLPKKELEILNLEKTKELNLLKLSNTHKFTPNEIKYLELEMTQQVDRKKLEKDLNINRKKLGTKIDDLINRDQLDSSVNYIIEGTNRKKWFRIPKFVYIIILILAVVALVFVSKTLIGRRISDKSTKSQIEEIISDTDITIDDDNSKVEIDTDDYHKFINVPLISVNLTKLKQKNPDTKGWIQVSGTNVNYPFVQTSDNDYYLSHSFDKSYNTMGWVFLDFRNDVNNLSYNTILYAHGLYNNTMFGSLKQVVDSSWYTNTDNHIIKISTEKENSLWQIFSTYTIEPESYYLTDKFNSDNEYNNFIFTIKSRSVYDYNVNIDTKDKILTLSSCYNDDLRVVVHAKLIKTRKRNIS